MAVIASIYKTASFLDTLIAPATLALPHPLLYPAARFSLWALYGFGTGLFATGLWVIGHECGHQAFSESKLVNNTVGWIIHSRYADLLLTPLRVSTHFVFYTVSASPTTHGASRTRNTTPPRGT